MKQKYANILYFLCLHYLQKKNYSDFQNNSFYCSTGFKKYNETMHKRHINT